MKRKLKNYFAWCAVTGRARKAMCQAEIALYTRYDFEELLRQNDITCKDCIAYAIGPETIRTGGEPVSENYQHSYCSFYKQGAFCGVAKNACPNRDKNLDRANKVARYQLARKRRRASFMALFVPDWLKGKLCGRSK